MNVIVANQKNNELSNLDIDVIKNINGQYEADEIVAMFKDFFYDRMIIDVTAIKNYQNIENIQKLAINLGEGKIILVLTDELCSSATYLSNIISMGVYNFTNNINAINQLIDHPNSYGDVAKIQQLNTLSTEISNRININGIKVLGIKNITDHAGATSLVYMLKKELSDLYGNSIYAIEINKRDFSAFNDKNMISVTDREVENKIRELANMKLILIDLNDCNDETFCDDILYLVEPSSIMLNKLIRKDRRIFEKLNGKKMILNKSLLSNKDVTEFEYESNSKVFFNLPPLDERKKNAILIDFLSRIGIGNETNAKKEDGSKIFGLFKH